MPDTPAPVQQIVWVSAAVRPFSPDDLVRLLSRSRASNEARGVTGMLLYHQGTFLQLMEGPPEEVAFVFEHRILRDSRHTDVTVLLNRIAPERSFPDFSMGFVDTSERRMQSLPGFREYRHTTPGFLHLKGDHHLLEQIIASFHEGSWHRELTAPGS